jgi:hypothetical protein
LTCIGFSHGGSPTQLPILPLGAGPKSDPVQLLSALTLIRSKVFRHRVLTCFLYPALLKTTIFTHKPKKLLNPAAAASRNYRFFPAKW